jgi:hypothetical protein
LEYTCKEFGDLDDSSPEPEIFDAMLNSAKVYYGEGCFDPFEEENIENNPLFGWDVLECNDLLFPIGQEGDLNMFPERPWSEAWWAEHCEEEFNITVRPTWVNTYFGGTDPVELLGYSNVFFSNGQLDPWHNFGVLESLTDSLVSFYIADSAHHLDLRYPNPADPSGVIDARNLERYWINTWIKQKARLIETMGDLITNKTNF